MTRGRLRIGTSGWQYRDWRGPVYPRDLPTKSWFAHYATLFDTVELNSTFYRMPAPETFDAWARQAPPGFLYALKLGAFGSHRMKLRDAATWLPNHVERARRLGPHLGPTLVQLPPRWRANPERLDEFLTAAPRALRWAVELRDETWVRDDVFAVLRRHRAALCLHDLLPRQPRILTTDWTYLRFHGPDAVERKYHGRYGGRRLWRIADEIAHWLDAGHDVYAYFNNDFHGDAVRDATWLRDRVARAATVSRAGRPGIPKKRLGSDSGRSTT